MPKLEELYLYENSISTLVGIEGVPALKKLHLRHNKIEKIEEEMPPLEKLEYLNLRANKIGSMEHLERLYAFATLTDLSVINNPVE